MVDINKYFDNQIALAKQRNIDRECEEQLTVSQKSKYVAEYITKKQNKTIMKNISQVPLEHDITCLSKSLISTSKEIIIDEDYLSSWNDDHDDRIVAATSHSHVKSNLKKIIDDGNHIIYQKRISKWRNTLAAAKLQQYAGSYNSADIQYILDEGGDPDEEHELHKGLRIPKFIWKQLYKYQRSGVKWLWELHQMKSGGMLADEMGLGKTVQIIAFLAGLFRSDSGSCDGFGPSIVVVPATVIYQWVSHFHYWFPQLRVAVLHHTGSHQGSYKKLIRDICTARGILIISYAGIVKYTNNLLANKWHYIILDEGHKIRNPEIQLSKLVKKFQTLHKIIITGSPMQNSLQELWSLFDFIKPGLLGTYKVFMEQFAVPITQGGYLNASELQKASALEMAKAIKNMIKPYMLRRTKAEVQDNIKLPKKKEQVLFCALSKEQRDLYTGYLMSGIVKGILDKVNKFKGPLRARVLVALSTLSKICNHPDLYLYEAVENLEEKDREYGHWKRSGKMSVVHTLLKLWQKQGHRTLIFSQSRAMIQIFQQYLQDQRFKYLKMDGTVPISKRQNLIKTFNENPEYLVFLSTTRVGGLGINLTGADRVILYDPDWNPAADNQAKERAWRIGQQKNVTVYRLLSAGTVEEKIYQRQIFKNILSNKILIDANQKNVFTTSSLQGLFTLEPLHSDGDTETATLFKHTRVKLCNKGKESVIEDKVNEMRKRAKEISKNISKAIAYDNVAQKQQEKYALPAPSACEINLKQNTIINVPFNIVLETGIVNKHTKDNYEESFIKDALKNENIETVDIENYQKNTIKECNLEKFTLGSSHTQIGINGLNAAKSIKLSSKRKYSSSLTHIENELRVKKIKNKKRKEKQTDHNDDNYVLNKLCAMSTVKNVLQHDMIGLAEKERKHRIIELAVENANKAVKAVQLSVKVKNF